MKSLKLHFESLLDDDDIFFDPENDKKVIEDWINNNYKIVGDLTISDDFVVDCKGSVYVNNRNIESLTNGLFRWGNVSITFSCSGCGKLTSLEGSPEEVSKDFNCSYCTSLTSLEGCPKRVYGNFVCVYCKNLKSFKGAPKKISYSFDCTSCNNITSLEGAPEKVMKFICNGCENLKTLEGAPKKIGKGLYCRNCKNLKITDSDCEKYKVQEY